MPALTNSRWYSTSTTPKQKAVRWKTPRKHPALPRYARAHEHKDTTELFRTTELGVPCPQRYQQQNTTIPHIQKSRTAQLTDSSYRLQRSQEQVKGFTVKLAYFPFVFHLTHSPHRTGENIRCYCTSRILPRSLRRIPLTTGIGRHSWLEVIEIC